MPMTVEDVVAKGFHPRCPSEVGLFLVACDESDYEPWHVAITGHFGSRRVHDPENGVGSIFDLHHYHHGLTNLHWKRLA